MTTQTAPSSTLSAKILVVEDESLIAMDLKQRLERLGYSVAGIAKAADEAVRLAAEHVPDLILMDIRLRGRRDGIEAANEIRTTLDIPVVFLTAHGDLDTIERAKSAGPFGYIAKPYERTDLRAHIEMAIAKHHTEKSLRQNRAWLAATLRSIGEGALATDLAGRIEFMNPVAQALTGWNSDAAKGALLSEVFDLLDPGTADPVASPVQMVLDSGGVRLHSGEYTLRSRDGSQALVQAVISLNQDDDGRVLGSVIVFKDITEQRRLERRTQQAQSMATVSVMAGGLAHDFNNLLTIILGYADLARSNPAKTTEALAQIQRAGDSAAALCRQLLTVSRNDVVKGEVFDLNQPVISSAKMLQQILGPACSLVLKSSSEPLPIAADQTQIQQVLINLAVNARDAMTGGGTLTISTQRDSTGNAQIDVRDTGIGMTIETRRRIFEPFFSRKGGQGAGLGMTIVHSLVSRWSGTIEVSSEPGRGTGFRISFPLSKIVPRVHEANHEFQNDSGELRGSGNILLVEDNADIRKLLVSQLAPSGFNTIEASSGEEALMLLGLHGDTLDLLITDVMMPMMTGPELAKRCLDRWPDTRILFMSGYSEELLQEEKLLKTGRADFVAKPVTPRQLVSRARKILSERPGRRD